MPRPASPFDPRPPLVERRLFLEANIKTGFKFQLRGSTELQVDQEKPAKESRTTLDYLFSVTRPCLDKQTQVKRKTHISIHKHAIYVNMFNISIRVL
jgi:hypothetical protein